MNRSTIAAIATPTGRGGIGIVRVSGEDALDISLSIFKHPETRTDKSIQSHHVYYGFINDESGKVVDEVILLYMKSPRSYTAEDVVEIQSHSSPVVLRKILDLLILKGADLASPGEFTKRAFLNGRIDLTQAEAVIDIINARTRTSLDMAVSQIKGGLKSEIQTILDHYTGIQSLIEAVIDFPDDAGDVVDIEQIKDVLLNKVLVSLTILENSFNDSNIFRDGIKIVIAGPPNSGKSSLLNRLLEKEKSIVTSIPGTTRDIIDDLINIDGIPFIITDTAGIHSTEDFIEKIGIERTFGKIDESDLILLMFDMSSKLPQKTITQLQTLNHSLKDQNKKVLIIENKIDLKSSSGEYDYFIEPDLRISVVSNTGIDSLKRMISDTIVNDLPEDKNTVVPNMRHIRLIRSVIKNTESIISAIDNDITYELIALDIQEAMDSLQEITGNTIKIDILDEIFNSFCIGK